MKLRIIMTVVLALILAKPLAAHDKLFKQVPNLSDFKEWVEDWEIFNSYYYDEQIDVIDMHMHPGDFDALGPKGREFVIDNFPVNLPNFLKIPALRLLSRFQLNPYGAFIGIKNQCRSAAVNNCLLFATYAPQTWGIESNDKLLGYLDDRRNKWMGNTYFYGMASIGVADWDNTKQANLAELQNALEHPKVVGIKLAFAHTLTPFDDERYYPIYDMAEAMNKPIYHHVGTSPLRKSSDFEDGELEFFARTFDPQYLEAAIQKYPTVNFIMGHIGNDTNDEGYSRIETSLAYAKKYDNVYLEISALGADNTEKMDNVFRRIMADGTVEKTIYGSDGPQFPGYANRYKEAVIESMKRVGYSIDQARLVMAGNARRVFGIPQ